MQLDNQTIWQGTALTAGSWLQQVPSQLSQILGRNNTTGAIDIVFESPQAADVGYTNNGAGLRPHITNPAGVGLPILTLDYDESTDTLTLFMARTDGLSRNASISFGP